MILQMRKNTKNRKKTETASFDPEELLKNMRKLAKNLEENHECYKLFIQFLSCIK